MNMHGVEYFKTITEDSTQLITVLFKWSLCLMSQSVKSQRLVHGSDGCVGVRQPESSY